ncbi:hypothetical protein CG716_04925 [Mycolicibacterium sphagni]|uniref:Uncharacterized protein n=2 Tax=Mycolicibacterium sphagni TaxID=1786 RepID=A0A255DX57_9MYCO|nr:hypothetical protein CG716_04925 [Mycolicibacterium sphagni]
MPLWLQLTEPDTEAVEDLKSALARLRKDGWTRGKLYDYETGKCCSLGAFNHAFPQESPGTPYLAYAIRTRKGGHPYPADMHDLFVITRFNDTPKRKFADVEAVFLAAIAYAEGKGVRAQPGT